jgi:CubicO group peptidase (beta-lactamase class C family)
MDLVGETFLMSKFLIVILAILVLAIVLYSPNIYKLYKLATLYNEKSIAKNFISINKIFDTSNPISASEKPFVFEKEDFELPDSYEFEGEQLNLLEGLDHFHTDGLIILHDGKMIFEKYWNGNTKDSKHIAFSVSKSYLSALFGIAIEEGLIKSIDDNVSVYLDDFEGTGYEDVKIKNLLQMSSGIEFNEDYADPNSDINRFARATAKGSSFRDFAKTLKNGKKQGTYNHYVSLDTQVLGMILESVTDMPLREYLYKRIWSKIGTENDAYYIADKTGTDMALGGLNATLRDFSKFGQLYLNEGSWDGEQIVPKSWVVKSHTPDAPHLMPNAGDLSSSEWGYGYQWWIPGDPLTDYTAHGIFNQFIYVDPVSNVVIAKTSSNHRFRSEKEYSKAAHIAMFRSITKQIENTFN